MKDSVSILHESNNRTKSIGWLFVDLKNKVSRILERMSIQWNDMISWTDLHLFSHRKIEKKGINFNINIPTSENGSFSQIQAQNIHFSKCDFSARNDLSVNFMNSQFENCTFDIRNFHNSSFAWARFYNCTFYTAAIIDSDISNTSWKDTIFKYGSIDFLSCEMKNLNDGNIHSSIDIPKIDIDIHSLTSKNVSFCTDFEWKEGCWSQWNKKRVVWAWIYFWFDLPKIPVLLFLSRDWSEWGSWKLAFMLNNEVRFALSGATLFPWVFYSIPNLGWQINTLVRERFLDAAFNYSSWKEVDYSIVWFWWSLNLLYLDLSCDKLILRPFRPASMGTPWFSEYVSESFRKMNRIHK